MSCGIAQVQPSFNECRECIVTQESVGLVPKCGECTRKVEVLQFIKAFRGTYGICRTEEGAIIRVPISRLKMRGEI